MIQLLGWALFLFGCGVIWSLVQDPLGFSFWATVIGIIATGSLFIGALILANVYKK